MTAWAAGSVLFLKHGVQVRMNVTWDRTDERGSRLPAGIYYAVLEGKGFRISRKTIVLNQQGR